MTSRVPPVPRHAPATSVEVGLLGALLALSVLLIHVPATLWAGNTTEFTVGFDQVRLPPRRKRLRPRDADPYRGR